MTPGTRAPRTSRRQGSSNAPPRARSDRQPMGAGGGPRHAVGPTGAGPRPMTCVCVISARRGNGRGPRRRPRAGEGGSLGCGRTRSACAAPCGKDGRTPDALPPLGAGERGLTQEVPGRALPRRRLPAAGERLRAGAGACQEGPAWPGGCLCGDSIIQTLVFLRSTCHVFLCQPAAGQALAQLPRELFPLQFKVAFIDKKTIILCELVHTWPFPLFSFQQLLQECTHCSHALLQECTHCSHVLLQEQPSTESMQAVILGLTACLHIPEEAGAGIQPLCRYGLSYSCSQEAHLLGSGYDDAVEQDPGTMSMWDCPEAMACTCITQYRSGLSQFAPVPVEGRVDLRVNWPSYTLLHGALQRPALATTCLCSARGLH
ncbi:LOW QUALITY PROTEIN: leucine-rich repeat-containing protein 14 [Thomomys bottae]